MSEQAQASTKERILVAARKMFAEHGYSGASIGKIARLAQVNHSLVFHHFTNKENLWLEVKQNIAKDSQQQSKLLPNTHLSFHDFLHELIIKSINFYRYNPDIIRMINWQRLESNTHQKIGVTLSNEMKSWFEAFKHYQQQGDINLNLKIEFIITMILSIVSSAALDQYIFINNEKDLRTYVDFCVDRLQKGLKA